MDAPKSRDTNGCPHCRTLQTRVSELESQLDLKSRQFSEAVAKLSTNQRAKLRAEQLDERFVEQCVRARTEAEIELDRRTKLFTDRIEKIKAYAQAKHNELARVVNKLRQQLAESGEQCRKLVTEVTQNSRHEAARYEQIITKLKAESSQKLEAAISQTRKEHVTLAEKLKNLEQQNLHLKQELNDRVSQSSSELEQKSQAYEQQIARLKEQYERTVTDLNNRFEQKLRDKEEQLKNTEGQLSQINDKIAENSREKVRAQQLNQRLVEQCRMAKAGADVEVEMRTKEFTESITRLKGQATSKLQTLSQENEKLKNQSQQSLASLKEHTDALNRANLRIKSLERAIAEMQRAGASMRL